jgi:hypothetical protein
MWLIVSNCDPILFLAPESTVPITQKQTSDGMSPPIQAKHMQPNISSRLWVVCRLPISQKFQDLIHSLGTGFTRVNGPMKGLISRVKTWVSLVRVQLAFKLFFGKTTMALIGREASFFKEASGSLSSFLARASQGALTEGTPSSNHYLHYILTGNYGSVLPHYLRRENFEAIRSNLDKVVLVEGSLQSVLEQLPSDSIDAFNLSDVFEYMTEDDCEILSHSINRVARRGGRPEYAGLSRVHGVRGVEPEGAGAGQGGGADRRSRALAAVPDPPAGLVGQAHDGPAVVRRVIPDPVLLGGEATEAEQARQAEAEPGIGRCVGDTRAGAQGLGVSARPAHAGHKD